MSGKFRCFSTAWIFIKKLFSLQRPPPWGKNNVAPRLQSVEEHEKLLEICCGSPVGNGFSLASSHRLGERTVRPAHFARPEWSDWVSHPSVEVIWFECATHVCLCVVLVCVCACVLISLGFSRGCSGLSASLNLPRVQTSSGRWNFSSFADEPLKQSRRPDAHLDIDRVSSASVFLL